MRVASFAVLAYPRFSLIMRMRGRLLFLECGPGLVIGAQFASFRCIGQKAGAGSLLSCLGPDFRAISSYAVLPFSAKSPVRHLSERLRLVSRTLLGWTGSFEDTPAAFSLVIPSTYTRLLL